MKTQAQNNKKQPQETKRLSFCFNGIEYESEHVTAEKAEIILHFIEMLLPENENRCKRYVEALKSKFPTDNWGDMEKID